MSDAEGPPRGPSRGIRAEILVLEPAAGLRARARRRSLRQALQTRGLATIHSIR